MTNIERIQAFLKDLTDLTKRHGISIGGCGCCGSPFLDLGAEVSDDRAAYAVSIDGADLKWVVPKEEQNT